MNLLDSLGKSLLDNVTEPFTMWMMDLEVRRGSCREYTLPPEHQDSELITWIRGHTRMGTVLRVKIICRIDQYRVDVQESSSTRDGSTSCIIISANPNRYVEELWHDPDNSPESRQMVGHTSVGRPNAGISSTGDTRASKPKTQSDLINNHSEDFIRIDTRKWNDILARGGVERKTLEWKISKTVTNLARHLDIADRQTDGAVHWNSMCSKLRLEFESEGVQNLPDSQWIGEISRGSNKTQVSTLRELEQRSPENSRQVERTLIADNNWSHSPLPLPLLHRQCGGSDKIGKSGKDGKNGKKYSDFSVVTPHDEPLQT